ncbi:MAG TPA: hypothetical protein VLA89_05630 [Gemmatimonadales bacterium]|nr:hypothetical protein [Gemmatimonadales bacterium]
MSLPRSEPEVTKPEITVEDQGALQVSVSPKVRVLNFRAMTVAEVVGAMGEEVRQADGTIEIRGTSSRGFRIKFVFTAKEALLLRLLWGLGDMEVKPEMTVTFEYEITAPDLETMAGSAGSGSSGSSNARKDRPIAQPVQPPALRSGRLWEG